MWCVTLETDTAACAKGCVAGLPAMMLTGAHGRMCDTATEIKRHAETHRHELWAGSGAVRSGEASYLRRIGR